MCFISYEFGMSLKRSSSSYLSTPSKRRVNSPFVPPRSVLARTSALSQSTDSTHSMDESSEDLITYEELKTIFIGECKLWLKDNAHVLVAEATKPVTAVAAIPPPPMDLSPQ